MQITDAQALAYGRRELVLNLWVEGRLQGEIIAAVPGLDLRTFKNTMDAARKRNDPRAVPRATGKTSDVEREKVIMAYALGVSPKDISRANGMPSATVHGLLNRARSAGDLRAAKRLFVPDEEAPKALRDIELPSVTRDVYSTEPSVFGLPREVSVRAITMIAPKPADALRPIAMSIERAQATPRGALTASLCGDPPPERSALGRECRPDEYANKGEGRWRDPMIGVYAGNLSGHRRHQ